MYKLCVFAGTSEGRQLVKWLASFEGLSVTACAATEYGGELLEEIPGVIVSAKRLDEGQMEAFFRKESFHWVIDATHPYAPIVTENIRAACTAAGTRYLRLLRDGGLPEDCVCVDSTAEAVRWLTNREERVLLTVGSKELAAYKGLPGFSERYYARVLPVTDSIELCKQAGVPTAHVIAMQGPFPKELNEAILHATGAQILVTKQTGTKGGFWEKVEAARAAGAQLLVIGRPDHVAGLSFQETAAFLCKELGLTPKKQVSIVGIGPGDREHRTLAAEKAIAQADCLIGAKRMLEAVAAPGQTREEQIAPEKIVEAIAAHPECSRFTVVMAGDIGFFSGTKKLLPLLSGCDVTLEPGISSLVTLCAKLGTSYEDVTPVSLHGRHWDIARELRRHKRIFALVGGEKGMENLCRTLVDAGLAEAKVSVGEALGYPEEKITVGTAQALSEQTFHKLSVALIEWAGETVVTQGLPDETFRRGSHENGTPVPMTKREIRAAALAHLELTADAVCWDIGAGTGSVSVELALAAPRGHVYAVECDPEACGLIRQNRGVTNVEIEKTGIKGFAKYAKRYHIDYAVQKDISCTPPRYMVYFKAQDTDALSAAFKEYSASVLNKTKRPSVLAKLQELVQAVAAIPDKVRNKDQELDL